MEITFGPILALIEEMAKDKDPDVRLQAHILRDKIAKILDAILYKSKVNGRDK